MIGAGPGSRLLRARRDWADTLLSNEHALLAGHFAATQERALLTSGPLRVLDDTTAFSYLRPDPGLIGLSGGSVPKRVLALA